MEGWPHASQMDNSLSVCAEESLEEFGTDPVIAALAQRLAGEAVQHLEGFHVLITNVQCDLFDLLFDGNRVLRWRPSRPTLLLDCMGDVEQ